MAITKQKKRKRRKLNRKTLYRVMRRTLFSPNESPKKRAQSVALAAFMSFIPLYGIQTILGVLLAFIFRLNKLLVAVLINIITPYPLVPLIIYFSFRVGGLFVAEPTVIGKNEAFSWQLLQNNLVQYLAGGTVLAIAMAFVLGGLSYPVFMLLKRKREKQTKPV